MEPLKYYYESYGNRELPEKDQGYAEITMMSAESQGLMSDQIVQANLGGKRGAIKTAFALNQMRANKKHCPKVFNVKDPLTDEIHPELELEALYKDGRYKSLYDELSEAINDVNILKSGLKKK